MAGKHAVAVVVSAVAGGYAWGFFAPINRNEMSPFPAFIITEEKRLQDSQMRSWTNQHREGAHEFISRKKREKWKVSSETRGMRYKTSCKDEFRRNLRSHSWSVFSFFIIKHACSSYVHHIIGSWWWWFSNMRVHVAAGHTDGFFFFFYPPADGEK